MTRDELLAAYGSPEPQGTPLGPSRDELLAQYGAPQGEPMGAVDAAIMGFGEGMYVPEIASMVGGEQGAHAQAVMEKAERDHPYLYEAASWAPWLVPGVGAAKGAMAAGKFAAPAVKAGVEFVKRHPELAADVAGYFTTGIPFLGTAARAAKSVLSKRAAASKLTETLKKRTGSSPHERVYTLAEAMRKRGKMSPEDYMKRAETYTRRGASYRHEKNLRRDYPEIY